MINKRLYTEKNIQKLISSSLNNANQLDAKHKEVVLDLLLQKMAQQKMVVQPKPISIIGLSVLWLFTVVLAFIGFADSNYILDLIKVALGLSLLLIPVSSIILIILKLRTHEKRLV